MRKFAWLGVVAVVGTYLGAAPQSQLAHGQSAETAPDVVRVWSGAAPGTSHWTKDEVASDAFVPGAGRVVHLINNVTVPTLTIVRPSADRATGSAMIVLPGGGFGALAWDLEGVEVARWLADHGIVAFVLKYRVYEPDAAKLPAITKALSETAPDRRFDAFLRVVEPRRLIAAEDALQAVRLVRSRAAEFGVAPNRIGMMGFSAGAITTMSAALGRDPAARPDFAAPIYGAMQADAKAPPYGPPLFIAAAADDDTVPVGKSVAIFHAWRDAGRPAELHVYETGGHGFGLGKANTASATWTEAFARWLASREVAASTHSGAASVITPGAPVGGSRATTTADRCLALAGTTLESGAVSGSERIAKGDPVVDGSSAAASATVDICRVRVQLQGAPGSEIGVEVWLPESWNRKLYGIGGAGFDGGLQPGSAALFIRATGQGYAAVASDAGHKAGSSLESWAHRQPERVVDFGHRANHLAAVAAKQLIAAYYGAPPQRSYFVGCSNGGRDGMMEASRYPDDYDGIVAGAPAIRYLEVLTQMIWFHDAVHGADGAPTLGSKLGLLNRAVLAKCDTLDGVKDGILENPLRCSFDPAELRCKGPATDACLTEREVAAFRKIHGGPRLSNGEAIYAGPALGSEEGPAGWAGWVVPDKTSWFGQEFYRWLVYDDPEWKVESYDIDRDYPRARDRVGLIVDVNDADLGAFARRNGKLIVYQGWYDPGITPAEIVKYYGDVRRHLGAATDDHVRLFMVPGMAHCADGPGASSFDMLPALESWVERNEAPARITATRPGGSPEFTHPLCPWPKTAHYVGTGATTDAANFTCK